MPKCKREPLDVLVLPMQDPRCARLGLKDTHPTLHVWMEVHKHYTLYWLVDFRGRKTGAALTLAGAARRYKRQEARKA